MYKEELHSMTLQIRPGSGALCTDKMDLGCLCADKKTLVWEHLCLEIGKLDLSWFFLCTGKIDLGCSVY